MNDPTRARIGLVSWLCLAGAVLGLLAVAWMMLGRPLWHQTQLHWHRSKAAEHLRQKDWHAAAEHVIEARRLSPEDADVMRLTADFLRETGNDAHLLVQTLDDLKAAGQATPEDELARVTALLDDGRPTEAREAFSMLPEAGRQSPAAWTAEARLLQEEGDHAAAREASLKALVLQKDDPQAALQLAIAESWNTPFEVQDAARRRLWLLAEQKHAAAAGAIQHLAGLAGLTTTQAEHLLRLAEAHPMAGTGTRLAAISAVMRCSPEKRNALLDAEVARHRDAEPEALRQVVFWLASESEHPRVLDLLPARFARQSRELFPHWVLSLAQAGRWQELRAALLEPGTPADREVVNVWLAWAEGHLEPGSEKSRLQLESAIAGAKKAAHAGAMRTAAQVAGLQGRRDLELECRLTQAAMQPREEAARLLEALPLARELADTRSLLAITRRLAELRPASEGFATQAAYYALLLGEALESQSQADLRSAAAQKLIAAFSVYRLGDVKTLAEVLHEAPDAASLPPGMRAVMAGLLARAGETSRAFQLAEKIQPASLLPEERRFWEMAR